MHKNTELCQPHASAHELSSVARYCIFLVAPEDVQLSCGGYILYKRNPKILLPCYCYLKKASSLRWSPCPYFCLLKQRTGLMPSCSFMPLPAKLPNSRHETELSARHRLLFRATLAPPNLAPGAALPCQ